MIFDRAVKGAGRRGIALAGVAVMASALMSACGGGGGDDGSLTLRWAYVLAAGSPFDNGAREVQRIVEEETDGRVRIEIFPGGQLGSDAETAEATVDGNIDINSGGLPYAERPELQVHVSPFVFRDADHLSRVMNGDVARERLWDPVNEAVGVEFLDSWYFGTMYFFSNKEFTTADSAKGVKIRTPEQQMGIDMIEAIGATPTPVAFTELYTALQTGTVDAMYGPLPNNFGAKLNEVTDYAIEFGYPSVVSTIINSETFGKLADEDQQIVRDAMHKVGPAVASETKEQEADYLAQAEDEMEVLDADVDSFRKAVQEEFVPGYEDIFGPGLYEALYNDQVDERG